MATAIFFLLFGIVIGGWMFARSQPRSLIALKGCDHCLSPADLAGLLGSLGMMRFADSLPFVIAETDKSVVIKHPFPYARIHYTIVPKKDIKDIGTVSDADWTYVRDAMEVAQVIIDRARLRAYRIMTNGPGLQSVTYLHFHLISNEKRTDIPAIEEDLAREWRERAGLASPS